MGKAFSSASRCDRRESRRAAKLLDGLAQQLTVSLVSPGGLRTSRIADRSGAVIELIVALVLIGLNGLFSLSELAIVSAKRLRLRTMAEQGSRGARRALALAEEPGRFLSTVQIGITLVGILAGAFSGAALGARLTVILEDLGVASWLADPLGYGVVIALITYLSVVIGELVPKHLALRNPERIAVAIAPTMTLVSKVAAPLVWLLDGSTTLVFRLFGSQPEPASAVTEEEIRTVVAEAETAGIIEGDERRMIGAVLRLGDRAVRGVMTPRTEVAWIDLTAGDAAIRDRLVASPHARVPIAEGNPDNMLGVIETRRLLGPLLAGEPLDIKRFITEAPVVPDTISALEAITVLRDSPVPIALVHDEYGHFDGIVTPADILDAIAGAFRSDEPQNDPEAVPREDGSWLLAGWMPADEMADLLGFGLPERRGYETVGGLVIDALRRLPVTGDVTTALGWRFEVVDMDGRRIDKVLASRSEG